MKEKLAVAIFCTVILSPPAAVHAATAPDSETSRVAPSPDCRCATETTAGLEVLAEPIVDASDRTIAVPRSAPRIPRAAPVNPRGKATSGCRTGCETPSPG
jgi:hypothetical protein